MESGLQRLLGKQFEGPQRMSQLNDLGLIDTSLSLSWPYRLVIIFKRALENGPTDWKLVHGVGMQCGMDLTRAKIKA